MADLYHKNASSFLILRIYYKYVIYVYATIAVITTDHRVAAMNYYSLLPPYKLKEEEDVLCKYFRWGHRRAFMSVRFPGLPKRVFQFITLPSSVRPSLNPLLFWFHHYFFKILKHTRSAVTRCSHTSKAEEEAIANHLSSPGSNNKRESRLVRSKKSLKLRISE